MNGEARIPIDRDRVGAVIGKRGSTKRMIEEAFNVRLEVDSESGTVTVRSEGPMSPIQLMKVRDVIRAISIGFTPEQALRLRDDDAYLEVVDLKEVSKSWRDMQRIKGRIIGEDGKTRRIIEEMTGATLVVGDREVGIIGDYEQVRMAREAVEQLIAGRPHRAVYEFLRVQQKLLKRRRMEMWEPGPPP